MNIALPAELEAFVNAQVQAGAYETPDAVVRDALRRLREEGAAETHDPGLETKLLECKGPVTPLDWADFEAIAQRVRERRRQAA